MAELADAADSKSVGVENLVRVQLPPSAPVKGHAYACPFYFSNYDEVFFIFIHLTINLVVNLPSSSELIFISRPYSPVIFGTYCLKMGAISTKR